MLDSAYLPRYSRGTPRIYEDGRLGYPRCSPKQYRPTRPTSLETMTTTSYVKRRRSRTVMTWSQAGGWRQRSLYWGALRASVLILVLY